jgi:hypothetical protein
MESIVAIISGLQVPPILDAKDDSETLGLGGFLAGGAGDGDDVMGDAGRLDEREGVPEEPPIVLAGGSSSLLAGVLDVLDRVLIAVVASGVAGGVLPAGGEETHKRCDGGVLRRGVGALAFLGLGLAGRDAGLGMTFVEPTVLASRANVYPISTCHTAGRQELTFVSLY